MPGSNNLVLSKAHKTLLAFSMPPLVYGAFQYNWTTSLPATLPVFLTLTLTSTSVLPLLSVLPLTLEETIDCLNVV